MFVSAAISNIGLDLIIISITFLPSTMRIMQLYPIKHKIYLGERIINNRIISVKYVTFYHKKLSQTTCDHGGDI